MSPVLQELLSVGGIGYRPDVTEALVAHLRDHPEAVPAEMLAAVASAEPENADDAEGR